MLILIKMAAWLKSHFNVILEGNVLFNNTLNTFYLWLYCKGPLR